MERSIRLGGGLGGDRVSSDVHTLTGAYVLNAASEIERAAFESHLAQCPSCTQEVAELRETTARLAAVTATAPPPALWMKVRAATAVTRQLPPLVEVPAARKPPSWPRRVALGLVAASVLAAISLGIVLSNRAGTMAEQLAESHNQLDKITAILGASDAKLVQGSSVDGGTGTVVMSRDANGMVLMTHGLPVLSSDQSFQAWFVGQDGQKTSAGILDAGSGTMPAPAADVSYLALTIEPRGGSLTPSNHVVLTIPTSS